MQEILIKPQKQAKFNANAPIAFRKLFGTDRCERKHFVRFAQGL